MFKCIVRYDKHANTIYKNTKFSQFRSFELIGALHAALCLASCTVQQLFRGTSIVVTHYFICVDHSRGVLYFAEGKLSAQNIVLQYGKQNDKKLNCSMIKSVKIVNNKIPHEGSQCRSVRWSETGTTASSARAEG